MTKRSEAQKEWTAYVKKHPVAGCIIALLVFLLCSWCLYFGVNTLLMLTKNNSTFPFWGGMVLSCLGVFRWLAIPFAACVWILSFFL